MKSGVKTAVSLLIAILIFGGITVVSSYGMFSTVEQQFYEPARLKAINGKLDSVADCSNEYITNLLSLFGYENTGFLSDESTGTFINQTPSDAAVRHLESLKENCPSLDGLRIVDQAGRRVYYSTFRNDYTIQTEKGQQRRIYSDYQNLTSIRGKKELEYSMVSAYGEEEDSPYIVFDADEQRIIFSYKTKSTDGREIPCSVLFYVNPVGFANLLAERHIISVNEQLTLVASSDGKTGGFVFGLPKVGQNIFGVEILRRWNEKSFGPDEIVSSEIPAVNGMTVNEETGEAETSQREAKSVSWSLISSEKSKYLHIGGVYSSEMLEMPVYVRILLLLCAFITVCLIIVIFFNIRKDDDVVIKAKIKGVQIGLLNEYFEKDVDRKKVAALIEAQKDALTAKIKKSLGRRGKKYGDDLDLILNRSWEDIINILSGNGGVPASGGISASDMSEIRRMFEEILSSGALKVQAVSAAPVSPAVAKPVPVLPKVSGASEVESLEEVEELDDVEEVDSVEEVESVESVEDIQSLDEVEEAESVEELDDAEPLEDAEPVESLEEVEELDDVEEVDSVEEVESVEELGEAEPLEEVDQVEELDDIDVVEELDDVEPVESLPVEAEEVSDGIEDTDSLGAIELEGEKPSVRSLDDTVVLENTEPVEELEEISEVKATEAEDGDYEIDDPSELIEIEGFDESVDDNNNVTFKPNEKFDREKFIGSEPLVIGDDTKFGQTESDEEDEFVIYRPFDYIFDDVQESDVEAECEPVNESEETAETIVTEIQEEPVRPVITVTKEVEYPVNEDGPLHNLDVEMLLDAAPLEELSAGKEGFMFTTFGANDNNVTELPVDAIVMGDDGVFQISSSIPMIDIQIDEDFKKLVDSVIR